jgi:hypothetical protein
VPSTQIANLIITKWRTTFIVQLEEFDLPNMVFDMISMWLHVYYLEKTDTDKQCGFVQTVADLGCAFRRNSGGIPTECGKRHRPFRNVTGTGTGMCYYYLRHSGLFWLVLVYEVPTGRKCA